jgi:hypothetical protein
MIHVFNWLRSYQPYLGCLILGLVISYFYFATRAISNESSALSDCLRRLEPSGEISRLLTMLNFWSSSRSISKRNAALTELQTRWPGQTNAIQVLWRSALMDDALASSAGKVLVRYEDLAIPHLRQAIKSASVRERITAVFLCSKMTNAGATQVLVDALLDSNPDVRREASWFLLARMHDRSDALPDAVLQASLADRDQAVRLQIALLLLHRTNPSKPAADLLCREARFVRRDERLTVMFRMMVQFGLTACVSDTLSYWRLNGDLERESKGLITVWPMADIFREMTLNRVVELLKTGKTADQTVAVDLLLALGTEAAPIRSELRTLRSTLTGEIGEVVDNAISNLKN